MIAHFIKYILPEFSVVVICNYNLFPVLIGALVNFPNSMQGW